MGVKLSNRQHGFILNQKVTVAHNALVFIDKQHDEGGAQVS